ncbi:hypothetical protein NPIL_587591 [Nephila pilipes]|uniref:Uncharacterized protein n=1 Tax=Nephila pilipes TaxID=299642 RepID=A0A8X6PFQ0_NEPPI|nr:hypothetical protein NPIL_587591 [Nephila pilipes]
MSLLPPPPPLPLLFRPPSQAIRLSRQSRTVLSIPPHASHCRDDFFLHEPNVPLLFKKGTVCGIANDEFPGHGGDKNDARSWVRCKGDTESEYPMLISNVCIMS